MLLFSRLKSGFCERMLRFASVYFSLLRSVLNAASLNCVPVIHTVTGSFCAFYAVPFGQAINQSIKQSNGSHSSSTD